MYFSSYEAGRNASTSIILKKERELCMEVLVPKCKVHLNFFF